MNLPASRARALVRTSPVRTRFEEVQAYCREALKKRAKKLPRVRCGGKRRSDGQPCKALSEPGKRWCKWHGGCATGPRTPEGMAQCLVNLSKTPSHRKKQITQPTETPV